jgi:hypothetical protein
MLLSVVVYNHTLTPGQWLGAAIVFLGISVEAWVKRKGKLQLQKLDNLLTNIDRRPREAGNSREGKSKDQRIIEIKYFGLD